MKRYAANPRYLDFRGKPILAVGSGEHYGAVLNADFAAQISTNNARVALTAYAGGLTGGVLTAVLQFGITGPQHAEGILVEAHPHMQAVFLDAVVVLLVSSRGSLSTKAPSLLIDGDAVVVEPSRSIRQRECCNHGTYATPKNGNFPSSRWSTTRWVHFFPHAQPTAAPCDALL